MRIRLNVVNKYEYENEYEYREVKMRRELDIKENEELKMAVQDDTIFLRKKILKLRMRRCRVLL